MTSLGRAGYVVDSATSARDGLRLAREKAYDAIVIDHRLRDMAGFEVLAALNDLDRNTPKVYVASSGAENIAIRAVERGATGYLLKTANFFELLPHEIEQQITRLRLRKEAERQRDALKASEERYRLLFERARDPVFVVDAEGHFLALNRALSELTGYEREELLRMNLFDLLIADAGSNGTGSSAFPSSDEGTLEFSIRKKDGSIVYVEVTTRLVQQGPLVVGVEAIARDITQKRAAERAVQKLYAMLSAVYSASSDGILVTDESGTVVEANPRVCQILGLTRNALVGREAEPVLRSFGERVGAEDRWAEAVGRAKREPEASLAADIKIAQPASSILNLHTSPVRDAAGDVTGRVWVLGESDGRRSVEASDRSYRDIFERSADGIVIAGRDGKLLEVNRAFCDLLGYSHEDLVGRFARDFVAPEVLEKFDRNMELVRDGGTLEGKLFALKVRTRSGETRRVQLRYVRTQRGNASEEFAAIVRDVTEMQRASESVRTLAGQLEAIFNASIDGIAVFDIDGRVRALNRQLTDLLEIDPQEFLNLPARVLTNRIAAASANPEEVRETFERLIQNPHVAIEGDLEVVRPSRRVLHQYSSPIHDRTGVLIGRLWTVREIAAAAAVGATEASYRELFEFASNGILLTRPDGTISDANPAACELFGATADAIVGKRLADFVRGALGGDGSGRAIRYETEVASRARGVRNVAVEERPILRAGKAVATEVTLVDFTERVEVNRRLEEAVSRLAAMYDATLDGIIFYDRYDRVAAVNLRYLELWGFRERDVVGRSIDEITAILRTYAKEPEGVDRTLREVRESPEAVREYVREYDRPKPRVLSWYSAPVRNAQGARIGRLWAVRDVTALQQARKALETSEANLREVIETVDEGIVRLGPDGTFLVVNPAVCRIFGRTESELLGRSLLDLVVRGSEDAVRANLDMVLQSPDRSRRFEVDVRTAEDAARPVEVHARVAGRSGSPASLIASIRDLSERREFERRLVQSERLASLGQLSAYVAHEINTPLTNISLLSAGISRKTQDAEILEKIQKIDGQRRIASTIIGDLLNYSRRPEPVLSDMDLRGAVDRALEDVDLYRNPEVKIHKEVGGEPLLIRGDPVQVQEVFANVVKNAYEVTERDRVEVRAWRQADGYVVATVEDTGPGISPNDLARVFEPFFTTKRLGKGTGLGLAICRTIMLAHGGQIEVESELGKGTRVTLLFPGRKGA